MEYITTFESIIGTITLISDGTYLTGLWFNTSRFLNLRKISKYPNNDDLPIFMLTKSWLDHYFNKENPDPHEIPIKLNGSKFSMMVWEILKKIPYGVTITYGDIAKIIAKKTNKKMSAQAVGYAVGHNPISIIIPCHRVVGANGNLTGYGGGLDIKIKLLELENVNLQGYYKPKRGNAL